MQYPILKGIKPIKSATIGNYPCKYSFIFLCILSIITIPTVLIQKCDVCTIAALKTNKVVFAIMLLICFLFFGPATDLFLGGKTVFPMGKSIL